MMRLFGLVILALACVLVTGWGVLALYYAGPAGWNLPLAAGYGLCGLVALLGLAMPRWRFRVAGGFLVVFAVLITWWNTIEPTNDRDWQTEDAVLAYATENGDLVTVHNIRNFDYRSETDFTPAYYDKTFDMRKLESVDLVAVYWMGPAIAHTFLSFGFKGGDYLAISIETRDAKGQGYS
ncbi:MAG: DUF4105 domain-containing protein, partial [Gammaproteobacteria bacterium]